MDVFAFREELVAEYERSSRSFAKIRAEDISREVDAAYDIDITAFKGIPMYQIQAELRQLPPFAVSGAAARSGLRARPNGAGLGAG